MLSRVNLSDLSQQNAPIFPLQSEVFNSYQRRQFALSQQYNEFQVIAIETTRKLDDISISDPDHKKKADEVLTEFINKLGCMDIAEKWNYLRKE